MSFDLKLNIREMDIEREGDRGERDKKTIFAAKFFLSLIMFSKFNDLFHIDCNICFWTSSLCTKTVNTASSVAHTHLSGSVLFKLDVFCILESLT